MRLIDADALLDEINGIYKRHYENSVYQFIHDFFRAMFRKVNKAPTVELVRCEQCKHYDWRQSLSTGKIESICRHPCGLKHPGKGKFCSCGERRDHD